MTVEPFEESSDLWAPIPVWTLALIQRVGWTASSGGRPPQILLGGNLELALANLAPGAPHVGLWDIVDPEKPYAVNIARDKALLVMPAPSHCASGWRAEGWSATPADSSYQILEFAGDGSFDLLRAAASADLDSTSRSAAVQVGGFACLLYRRSPAVAVLHIEQALAPALWTWLSMHGESP